MRCPDCERIRRAAFPENRVLMSFPTVFTRAKTDAVLARSACVREEVEDPDCLAFTAGFDALVAIAAALKAELSSEEAEDVRVLVLPADRMPSLSDSMRTVSLRRLAARLSGVWLVDMIEQERLFVMMQPVLTRDGALFGHESLLRGRGEGGEPVPAGKLFGTAEEAGLLFTLDLIARRLGIETVGRAAPKDTRLFINFNPSSIYDPAYCLKETASFIAEAGIAPGNVIFEVIESAEVRDRAHLLNILRFYREAGFRIALDDVGAGFSGLTMLQALRPDIVKIDMALVQGVAQDSYKQSIVHHLIDMCHEGGAQALAEGIEAQEDLDWLKDAGIDLVQGYLLGRPRVPETMVAG